MLKSICGDAQGRLQLDDESGETEDDCGYAKLMGRGYTGLSLGSVADKDWDSLKCMRNLASPKTR